MSLALSRNKNALEFYRRLGAQAMGDWVLLRLNAVGLQHLARQDESHQGA